MSLVVVLLTCFVSLGDASANTGVFLLQLNAESKHENSEDDAIQFNNDNLTAFGSVFKPSGERPHLIIGAGMPKCGSTFMFDVLQMHNDTIRSIKKETIYFNTWMENKCKKTNGMSGNKAEVYLKACYEADAWKPGKALMEFSPGYMTHGGQTKMVAQAIKEVEPFVELRVIATVREPVGRAISEINMFRNLGTANGTDSELSNLMASRINQNDYSIDAGEYAPHIAEWLDVFRKEQILVVNNKALGDVETWRRIYNHLGLVLPTNIADVLKTAGAFHAPDAGYLELSSEASLKLQLHYQAFNDKLWNLMGVEPWW